MRRIWPRVAKIYWDPWRNIPVIRPKQQEIDLYYIVRLTEPGDARPAFPGDFEKLRDSISYEYGTDKLYGELYESQLVLLNKVPHWDVMYEVISSGNVYGQLYFDPFRDRWRFRLTYAGAYLASEKGWVDVARVGNPIYVGKTAPAPSTSMKQLVVVDERERVRGLGEVYGNELVIVKTFHEKIMPVETEGRPATLEEAVKYNEEGMAAIEEKSVKYLKRLSAKFPLPVTVSYSGGKDSLVALDLAYKAFGQDIEMVFNDTGLELPETLRNVEEVSRLYGLKLHVASAGDIFWKGVELFGPPGKDYRWCCKVAKLVPIAKLTRARWPNGAFNIVGQRAYESLDRAKSPRIWRNKWIPHMITTTPIQEWSQLECWMYIYRYKLPYNKLYEKGFDRLGCFLCPSSAVAEFHDIKKEFPELWGRWEGALLKWRDRLGQPNEWVSLGLWRWLSPSTAKKRIARHVKGYSIDWKKEYALRLVGNDVGLYPVEKSDDGRVLRLVFNKEFIPDNIAHIVEQNAGGFGYDFSRESNGYIITTPRGKITIRGKEVILERAEGGGRETFEDLVDVIKVVYRSLGCLKCGSCVLWTTKGAVKLTERGPVPLRVLSDREKRFYLEACPISDQLVEKVFLPLILDTPKAYKRESRRRIITYKRD